jgi:hypothetical protein
MPPRKQMTPTARLLRLKELLAKERAKVTRKLTEEAKLLRTPIERGPKK